MFKGDGVKRRAFVGAAAGLSLAALLGRGVRAQADSAAYLVHLRCQGGGAATQWLEGHSAERRVTLGPTPAAPHVGALWRIVDVGDGAVALQCADGFGWLDGNTINGAIGLAPVNTPPYTGAHWRLTMPGGGAVALQCLGNIEGPRWLAGRASDGVVGMIASFNPGFLPTRWLIELAP